MTIIKDKEKLQKVVITSACDFQYLYHFVQNVKEVYPDLPEETLKQKVLNVINILLQKKIIAIHNLHDEKKWNLTIEQSLKKINEIWFKGAKYPDFINMMFFKYQDWFYQKLRKEGYDFKSNWVEYVQKNEWLEEILKID